MAKNITEQKTLNTENKTKCMQAKAEWLQEKQAEIEKMTVRQVYTKKRKELTG